jgi:sarcosine oxidase
MMGSAAARYLAARGLRTVVIGPDEPANYRSHTGVYASHYDQARLTYQVSQDALWSYLGMSSIARYADIEARSGIRFHAPVGKLTVYAAENGKARAERAIQLAAELSVPLRYLPAGEVRLREVGPGLSFPSTCPATFEADPAGYINPRRLVQAQLALAHHNGAVIARQEVRHVEEFAEHVRVNLADGRVIVAGMALVAAGAFSNFHRLLPAPLPLRIKTETIILGKVDNEEAARLTQMPVVVYEVLDSDISEIYMTPPVRYPDGHFYAKLGANTVADQWPQTLEEVREWFRQGDSDGCLPALSRALRSLMPDTTFTSVRSARCIVCYTPSRAPTIDRVPGSERLFVAAGGNGMGAKGSDCSGRLAAGLMLGDAWPDGLAREPFQWRG